MSFHLHVRLLLYFFRFAFHLHSQLSSRASELRTCARSSATGEDTRRTIKEIKGNVRKSTRAKSRTTARTIGERIVGESERHQRNAGGGNECNWKKIAAREHLIEFPPSPSHPSICDKKENYSAVILLRPKFLLSFCHVVCSPPSGFFRLVFVKDRQILI